MRRLIAIVLVISVAVACSVNKAPGAAGAAAAPAPAESPAPAVGQTQQSRGSSRDVITRAEIESTQGGVPNAYDLVRRLRPHFLRVESRTSMASTSNTPLVRLNGNVLGEIDALRTIDMNGLEEIRYYSIVEAETRWSGVRGRPVIAVTSRKLTGK